METEKFVNQIHSPKRKLLKELWKDEASCHAIFKEVFPADEIEKIVPAAGAILKGKMGYDVWITALGNIKFYLNYNDIKVNVSMFKLVDLIRELGYEPKKL